MDNIFEKAASHFQNQLPFVLYAKPNSTDLIGFFQQNKKLHTVNDFTERGFVFADFSGNQVLLFPEKQCEVVKEAYASDAKKVNIEQIIFSTDGKETFEQLVTQGIKAIETGAFDKVVLSRKESLLKTDFSFLEVFQNMLPTYPGAFRYCWFHPEIGMWMGATPEQLLKIESAKFKTVALAGTQKWNPDSLVIWEEKERQEQQFVTDFIISNLQNEVEKLSQTKPYTFQAGNLVHLKTDIEGVFKTNFSLNKVLNFLHPTPAVCGLPKASAKQFIFDFEGYDRKFYAGYLGELNRNMVTNQNSDSDLFVNLRCMEIQQNQLHLYIGCGITKDSDPEKEYFETANKAVTMKQILN